MPVYAHLNDPASNKQGNTGSKKIKLDCKRVSYSPLPNVYILKPHIDKISITYKIADADLTDCIVESLLMKIEQEKSLYASAKSFKAGTTVYQAAAILILPHNGSHALVQAKPKNKAPSHHLRLEFNPAALGSEGIAFLKAELEALQTEGLDASDIINNGLVTKVDIAVDILGAAIDALDVRYHGSGGCIWYYGEDGTAETGYYGHSYNQKTKKNNNSPWKLYNKTVQIAKTGASYGPAYGQIPLSRIEYTATSLNKRLAKLATLTNPFFSVSLARAVPPPGAHPGLWQFFIDSCHQRGLDRALKLLPTQDLKNVFLTALNSAHSEFWRPHKIWSSWDEAIQTCGLL